MIYYLQNPFVIDAAANPRFGDPSISEVKRAETVAYFHGCNRVLGGDLGDLVFDGYEVVAGQTILSNPGVWSEQHFWAPHQEQPTDAEVSELAWEIFHESFDNIGIETVEHS
jgi:hypothetical protein